MSEYRINSIKKIKMEVESAAVFNKEIFLKHYSIKIFEI